ncbi:MAG: DUF1501 domain-containing protein [Planctomycetota bacterium]|nr:MAG: DUF1501 domain-containing protein [Planctomycetota bacterium]
MQHHDSAFSGKPDAGAQKVAAHGLRPRRTAPPGRPLPAKAGRNRTAVRAHYMRGDGPIQTFPSIRRRPAALRGGFSRIRSKAIPFDAAEPPIEYVLHGNTPIGNDRDRAFGCGRFNTPRVAVRAVRQRGRSSKCRTIGKKVIAMCSPGTGERSAGHPSVSRRDFLRVGGLSVVGLTAAEAALRATPSGGPAARRCLFVLLAGGASQLDTFDPKPTAPSGVRGPLKAIGTALPGVLVTEGFPHLARRLDRCTLIRSLYHDAAPIHETGLQLLMTGGLFDRRGNRPAIGSVLGMLLGSDDATAAYALVPGSISRTGTSAATGQGPGPLGEAYRAVTVRVPGLPPEADPLPTAALARVPAPSQAGGSRAVTAAPARPLRTMDAASFDDRAQQHYGRTRFGRLLHAAVRQIEEGSRLVVANLFDELEGRRTFDCHGTGSAPATLFDYRDRLCPQLDVALAAALDDLSASGLLDETLVVVTGEFGRSPVVNDRFGREHWPRAWSALLAGASVPRGAVIGRTDEHGGEIIDTPIHAARLPATILAAMGIDPRTPLPASGDTTGDATGRPLIAATPIEHVLPIADRAEQT